MIRAVPFKALGRDFNIRFTTNALCRVEAISGRSFTDLAESLSGGFAISDLRVLFAAGIGITDLDEAGDIIDDLGLHVAGELIGTAIKEAFPDAVPSAEGNGEGKATA